MQCGFLLLNGVLVSVLSESMHRAHAKARRSERQQRKASTALGANEALLRTFFETSMDGALLTDVEGTIAKSNRAAQEMFGYTEGELRQAGFATLLDLRDPRCATMLAERERAGCFKGELHCLRKDGSLFPVEISSTVFLDPGGNTKVSVLLRDVSARKLEEAAKLNRERKLNAIVDNSPSALSLKVADGRYALANHQLQRSLGMREEDIVGKTDFDLYPRAAAEQCAAHDKIALASLRRLEAEETLPVHGIDRIFMATIFPVLDEQGGLRFLCRIALDITERKLAEVALRTSEERLQMALSGADMGIWDWDIANGSVVYSPSWARMMGVAPEVLGSDVATWEARMHPDDREAVGKGLQSHLRGETSIFVSEHRLRHDDGHWLWTLGRGKVTARSADGAPLRMVGVAFDISERKNAEDAVRKLSQAVEQSHDSVIITNVKGDIEYVNAAFSNRTGYLATEVIGKNPRLLNSGRTPPATYAAMWKSILCGEAWRGQITNRRKDGSDYVDFAIITPIRQADGKISHFVSVQQDITERMKANATIEHLAFYDQLTGLPNRVLLADRLHQAVNSGARNGQHGVLMMIDLDNFKMLNDTLGHDVGDLLLKQVGQRLHDHARKGDTVARLGGDEFMIVLAEVHGDQAEAVIVAKTVARQLLAVFDDEFDLQGTSYHCSASIGITLFQGEAMSCDDLMKQADLAMYQAKQAGRNTIRFFDPAMEAAAKLRSQLEKEMRLGLDQGQFVVYYQPQVVGMNQLVGAEALVRWRHPSRGLVPPDAFIPVAEDSRLILPLGRFVLETACAQLALWARHPATMGLTIAVNVSAVQFRQADFVAQVQAVLAASGAPVHCLKLELTESLLVENVDDVIEKMSSLKAHGVGFSLDDFGTGYSSLAYLKRLPLNQLKIDQSFVRCLLEDQTDAAIASTVVALAGSLGLGVIAEGVETEAQRGFLAALGCHECQGYLFSRPLPIDLFEQLPCMPLAH